MSSKSHEMDLCSGSLWKKIFVYSVPLMFTNILQVLFNMSDVAVVGKFAGPIALGAVGSTSILVTLFTGILLGLASGVNALTALHIGSKDDEGVKRTVHTAVIICLAGGILITVFGILFSHNILALMNTKDELIDGAVLYLRIYLLGMPALGLYNFGNAVLSAAGDTKRPLYYLAFAGVVNVILNLFFVIVCHLGVAGVALASMISQFISAFLILRALLTGKEKYCLRLSEIRFDKRKAVGILQIGIPSAFQYSLFAFANLFVQSSVNSFDHVLVEGNSAAANADPDTIKAAQEAISDDGYWGIKQTSDRMVSMAIALTGGDTDKADEMISAIEKGFKQATKSWGEDLPDICQKTLEETKKKMNDWKNGVTTAADYSDYLS